MCMKSVTNRYFIVVGDFSGILVSQMLVCQPEDDHRRVLNAKTSELLKSVKTPYLWLHFAEEIEGTDRRCELDVAERAFKRYRDAYIKRKESLYENRT